MEFDHLSQLAMKYRTDKFGSHLYTPVYHTLFSSYRDRPVKLLEIGIGGYANPTEGGESLRMWAEYFPKGAIIGIDIVEKKLDLPSNVTIFTGNQSDAEFLKKLNAEHGPFDIIIDDGSHNPNDVLASFHALYPIISSSGLYIVEDTHTEFWPSWGGNINASDTIMELAYHIMVAMHHLEIEAENLTPPHRRYGDITVSVEFLRNLLIFTRGDNTYPSNHRFDYDHPLVKEIYTRDVRRP